METETTESQTFMKKTSCAFTGHRPTRFSFKYDETHPACIELKKVLAEQIDFLYRQGITDFYTGCALGIDLWAGETVLALMELHPEIKLHCVVPFAAQDQKWTLEQQARYHALLDWSSDVILTQEKYSKDCYYIRNRYLVDHPDGRDHDARSSDHGHGRPQYPRGDRAGNLPNRHQKAPSHLPLAHHPRGDRLRRFHDLRL